jgi:DNA adenine methylase
MIQSTTLFEFEDMATVKISKKDWLKPMFKWSGGKSRELPFIHEILPPIEGKVIEPFIGGGAFFLSLKKESIINDNDPSVVNFYKVVKEKDTYEQLKAMLENTKKLGLSSELSKEQCRTQSGNLCNLYYNSRDILNSDDREKDRVLWAHSFLVVRQLCFSGMHRVGNTGKFNVPFGWYKEFTTNLCDDHHKFLQNCTINLGNFGDIITDELTENDFIFLDPPYINRAGYTDLSGTLGTDLHDDIFNSLVKTKAKWMIVHCDHPYYLEKYKNFNIIDNKFTYSQNFKGRESKGARVSHLYITNYSK